MIFWTIKNSQKNVNNENKQKNVIKQKKSMRQVNTAEFWQNDEL